MMRRIIAVLMIISVLLCAGCRAQEPKEVTPTTKDEVCTIIINIPVALRHGGYDICKIN